MSLSLPPLPCVVLWLALCACAAPRATSAASGAGTDPNPGEPAAAEDGPEPPTLLRIGTSGDYAPFSTESAGGRTGFDVEVASELARDLGLRVEWVPFRWPELERGIAAGDFDVAMSGITCKPERAVRGYMTRAVARGGPCLLGSVDGPRVAVNRGGALEVWAREHLSGRSLSTVDDNLALPGLLAGGEVDAIVTDSFELSSFRRPGWQMRCEPPLGRKVYWVAPASAGRLGPVIDDWLARRADFVRAAQARWLDGTLELNELSHLEDLLARRMAFMPAVAAYKRRHGLPIEDRAREERVLAAALDGARDTGLPPGPLRALFELQIELSKNVQQRSSAQAELDLESELRPALLGLGERIVLALRAARQTGRLATLQVSHLGLLSPWLTESERARLADALRGLHAQ
jgi:cyclohexadienyl dehydratase